MTTIERPHGAGTLVIRPSGPVHQGTLSRPHPKPTTPPDLQSAASQATSSSSEYRVWRLLHCYEEQTYGLTNNKQQLTITPTDSIWHTSTHQQTPPQQQPQHHHWHMTTEPSFITRPRPTGWTKPGIVNLPATMRPSKPAKPTKKPIVYERPPTPLPTTTTTTTTMMQARPKPKPKPIPTRPQVCKYASSSLCLLATIPHPVPHALCVCDALMSKAKQTSDEVIYSSIRLGYSDALML